MGWDGMVMEWYGWMGGGMCYDGSDDRSCGFSNGNLIRR